MSAPRRPATSPPGCALLVGPLQHARAVREAGHHHHAAAVARPGTTTGQAVVATILVPAGSGAAVGRATTGQDPVPATALGCVGEAGGDAAERRRAAGASLQELYGMLIDPDGR